MKFLRRFQGLQTRLTAFAVATVIVALAICGAILVGMEVWTFPRRLESEMAALGRVLAANCAPAVVFDDRGGATRSLKAILGEPDALGAALYRADGRLLAEIHAAEAVLFPDSLPHSLESAAWPLNWSITSVDVDGETAGKLIVAFTFRGFWSTVVRYGTGVAGAMLMAASGAILVSRRLARSIAAPVEEISRAAKEMTRFGYYSRRVSVDISGEIGDLAGSFNSMASEVQKRDFELREANRELEQRVNEQTRQLMAAYESARDARELIERRRLETEIVQISNRERARIAHDLHDDLGQRLASMAMTAKAAELRLRDSAASEADRLCALARDASEAVAVVRQIAHGLDPMDAGVKSLGEAISELISHMEGTCPIRFRLKAADLKTDLQPELAIVLYRIAQEAVSNAVRHSSGSNVVVEIRRHGSDELELRVTDDGIGIRACPGRSSGIGLRIMRYRAASVCGTLRIESPESGGTSVTCRVPRHPSRQPANSGP